MVKSSVIVGVITFILILISGLLYNVCCLLSPVVAVALGLAAGFVCSVFEKPVDAEKAAVRGAIAGAVTGGVALVAQFVGQTVAQAVLGANAACLPGMCSESSQPINQTSVILYQIFNSCFCGLILLMIMAGLGAVGAVIWTKTLAQKQILPPAAPSAGHTV